MEVLNTLPAIDWACLVVLGLSVLVGLWRGFVFEVLALAGWLVAYFAAQWALPLLAPWVPVGTPGQALNQGATLLIGFVAAMLVWAVVVRLIRMALRASTLAWTDRLLGAVFGLVRGVVLLLVLTTLGGLTPLTQSPAWQRSMGARLLEQTLQAVAPMLPPQAARWLPKAAAQKPAANPPLPQPGARPAGGPPKAGTT